MKYERFILIVHEVKHFTESPMIKIFRFELMVYGLKESIIDCFSSQLRLLSFSLRSWFCMSSRYTLSVLVPNEWKCKHLIYAQTHTTVSPKQLPSL